MTPTFLNPRATLWPHCPVCSLRLFPGLPGVTIWFSFCLFGYSISASFGVHLYFFLLQVFLLRDFTHSHCSVFPFPFNFLISSIILYVHNRSVKIIIAPTANSLSPLVHPNISNMVPNAKTITVDKINDFNIFSLINKVTWF